MTEKITPKQNMAFDGSIDYVCRKCGEALEFDHVDDLIAGAGTEVLEAICACGMVYEVHAVKTIISFLTDTDRKAHPAQSDEHLPEDSDAEDICDCAMCQGHMEDSGDDETNECEICGEEIGPGEELCADCAADDDEDDLEDEDDEDDEE